MKNKECFPTYESARFAYDNNIVPNFGATRLECGFGRWLWLDVIGEDVPDPGLATWRPGRTTPPRSGRCCSAARPSAAKASTSAATRPLARRAASRPRHNQPEPGDPSHAKTHLPLQ